jgi:hypothetical protein
VVPSASSTGGVVGRRDVERGTWMEMLNRISAGSVR